MEKRNAPPGYRIERLNIVRAEVARHGDWPPKADTFRLDLEYADRHKIEQGEVWFEATLIVHGVPVSAPDHPAATASATLDVVFKASAKPNIPAEQFAEQYAPVILFPYLREYISRLTSDLWPLPPMFLAPVNILAVRERRPPGTSSD